ncbi:MAG: FoF1 ATP synthase subunit gamma [Pseudomonadota bacterium]
MSKRREVKKRLATLDEIDGIMGAMKNLALLETRKLGVFLDTQRRATATIEAAANDFLSFFATPPLAEQREVLLLFGSERGFCGDFNESLLAHLAGLPEADARDVIAVGGRLEGKLRDDDAVLARIEGASVAEEVPAALLRLVETLNRLQSGAGGAWRIAALYHDDKEGGMRRRDLLPLPHPQARPAHAYAPLLNVPPADFLAQLSDQYLYAALHEVYYASLMAENRMRLEHMDSAMRRLEKDEAVLRLRYNALRQEEIIEEIEVILLSAEALAEQ